jgi:hypothetical protein
MFAREKTPGTRSCTRQRGHFSPAFPWENPVFLKILLRGFKSSLISAARPNKSGGSEDEVKRNFKEIRFDHKV